MSPHLAIALRLGVLALILAPLPGLAQTDQPGSRSELRRSVAEYLYLGAQLGFRHRDLVYAEDAAPGPSGRSEVRVFLNGRAESGPGGPLGAYVGLGLVRRLNADMAGIGDPLADAYDDFRFNRNVRLFGAHVEWVGRDDEGAVRLLARAGRLTDLDDRAQLLLFDGALLRLGLGRRASISAYGGRRAVLDGSQPDQREDLRAQAVAGAMFDARFGDVALQLAYRFEDVHRPGLRLSWLPDDNVSLGFGAQVIAGGREAVAFDGAAEETPLAARVRLDGAASTVSGETSGWAVLELQVGRDPRPFGRGGIGPTLDAVRSASGRPIGAGTLDRLFFGPGQPHGFAELGLEHWLLPWLAVQGGAYARQPLGDEAVRSLRPGIVELWAGPEVAVARGQRIGVEGRVAFEDPGEVNRVFAPVGDGVRRFGGLRAWAELPFAVSESWTFALRPEGEGSLWDVAGPLSEADHQLGLAGGLLATLRAGPDFRVAARYGIGSLPAFGGDGVHLVHDLEVWVGGAY